MNREQMKLTDQQQAREKGFDNVGLWYLACLNAEVNVLADPTMRDTQRIEKFVEMARSYIGKLDKCLSLLHGEELRERIAERIFLCYQEDTRKTLEMDAKLTDEKIEYRVRSWDSLAYDDKAFHYECADEVISLFPLKEEEKKDV
ncbi:hypothetical protein LCGC14_0514350 [marine sediment metagenome]|uniref:Uncharacterized protein n=1 Tax=marine sediment metagenome TaxID=412755 RepID=A0A0F9ULQ1_9ZZZZ